MTTVSLAVRDFFQRLEPTDADRTEARRQLVELRARMRGRLAGVERDVATGSFARGTGVRPLCVDLLFVLEPPRRGPDPTELLGAVEQTLRACYPSPGPRIRIEGGAVCVAPAGASVAYAIAPAFALREGVYEVPDRRGQAWIATSPDAHAARCTDADRRAHGMLRALIRAVKHWNRGAALLSGFHVEAMMYDALQMAFDSHRVALTVALGALATRVLTPCPDPAGVGPPVDADLSADARQRAAAALREAAETARRALTAERGKDDTAAIALWREILGSGFAD